MSKRPSKYIAVFEYIDKTLIVLSTTGGGISIISFTSIIGIPAGMASASFTNNKETVKSNKEKKEETQ